MPLGQYPQPQQRNPLPPPPVLTPPSGWLGFLGIKSGGKQPTQVAQYLTPTMEMTPFYQGGARVLLATAVQAAATNLATTTNNIQVPQGKVWNVEAVMGLSTAQGAAAASSGAIIITDPANNFFYIGPPSNPGVTGNTMMVRTDRGLLSLGPGYSIRVYTAAPAAITAFNYNLFVFGQEVSA